MSSRVSRAAARRETAPRAARAGTTGIPSCAYTDSSSGAAGKLAEAFDVRRASRSRRSSSVPNRAGSATTSSTGTPSTVTPTARRSLALEHATRSKEAPRTRRAPGQGRAADDDDREVERGIRPAARITCNLAAQRRRDLLEQRARPVQGHPFCGCGLPSRSSAAEQPLLRLRPDPGHRRQPACAAASLNSSAVETSSACPDLHHPLRADPEKAAEPDELGLHFAFELVELRDRPGLDELAQARRDAGADPAQLLDAAGRTSSATGACVARIVSAARRYARDV